MTNIYEQRAGEIFTSEEGQAALGYYDQAQQIYCFGKFNATSHNGQMLPPMMAPVLIKEACKPAVVSGSALYLHIPFCNLRCTYCGFYKSSVQEVLLESYTKALLQEIDYLAEQGVFSQRKFNTIFFGGGTPSTLSPEQITRILNKLQENVKLAENPEITFESSIYDMSDEKFAACLQGGINRFSFGTQTFNTARRRSLGRPDPQEKLVERLRYFAQSDAKIIIDLIYGLPEQTEAELLEDLHLALSCNIAGLDLYKLQILPKSPLALAIEKEKVSYNGAHQRLQAMFTTASAYLEKHGAKPLSCCHWATKPEEISLYNTIVKRGADIVALGSACGGRVGNFHFMKHPNTQTYLEQIAQNKFPLMFLGKQDNDYLFLKELEGQIDTGYIDLPQLTKFNSLPWSQLLLPLLNHWQTEGLLEAPQKNHYSFTTLGKYWCKYMSRTVIFLVEYILYGAVTPSEKAAMPAAMNAMKNLK